MGRLARMTCLVSHTTVDCRNAYELSEWWKALLGYQDVDGDPNEPGHEECMILDPASGHHILFIEVPEAKDGKNRLHFDLVPRTGTRDEETDRVLAAGARSPTTSAARGGRARAGRSSLTPRATSSACSGARPRRPPPPIRLRSDPVSTARPR
jgi:Glyoxalase-like domain